jgi:alpha-tubulin suppressor-like RCC1 family protein
VEPTELDDSNGQLGAKASGSASSFVSVEGILSAQAVVAGDAHTCVLLKDKTVRCWGNNSEGQLGNGERDNSPTPVQPKGLPPTITLFAGKMRTCAVDESRQLRCWGTDSFGIKNQIISLRSLVPVVVAVR